VNRAVIYNDSGNNTIEGNLALSSGNGGSTVSSESGLLTLNGSIAPSTSGRDFRLRGDGNGIINGVIANGATSNMPLFKDGGTGTWTLTGANIYTGATTVSAGTLALVGGSQASAITVGTGASLGFTLGSPTTSTGTFNLSAGTIKITGTPTLPSYTLISSSAGITGDPVLDTPIAGYALYVDGNSLVLTNAPYALWAAANNATGGKTGDSDNDGLDNLTEFAFGTNPQSGALGPITYSAGVVTATGQPVVVEDAGVWYAVFGRRTDYVAAGLVYTVEFGAGLDQWTASVTVPTTVATDGVIDAVRVPFPNFVSTPSGPKKPTFFRVDISETP
jgi:autotransporter-associated beta strand protein